MAEQNLDQTNVTSNFLTMSTFDDKTYRHHPKELSDPTADMSLLEIIKYRINTNN